MSVEHDRFDLVVVGCGPGGEKAAAQAAYFGKRVAVVEKMPVGGACAHTGTLPSKALRESALRLSGLRDLDIEGMEIRVAENISVQELMAHKEYVCRMEEERIYANLERHGIELVQGRARLNGPSDVAVTLNEGGTRVLRGDVIVLATGSSPYRPGGLPFESESVWDSDQILGMKTIPKSMVVYGAGVIGCEYAGMFAALGVEVTLIEPREMIIHFIDSEVVETLLSMLRRVMLSFPSFILFVCFNISP